MPYLPTSQQWLQQSALLLEARPTTVRIPLLSSPPPYPAPLRSPQASPILTALPTRSPSPPQITPPPPNPQLTPPQQTRITTTYSLPHPSRATKKPKSARNPPPPSSTDPTAQTPQPQPQTATLTLKTYDPVSGATLKYQTNKGAEVGRLIAALGKLGRGMSTGEKVVVEEAAQKEGADVVMGGTGGEGSNEGGRGTPVPVEEKVAKGGVAPGANAGAGGGGGKKKKGKGGKK
jgi:hypothetical protein